MSAAIIDLVAATERSAPAHKGKSASASRASGDASSLTKATDRARCALAVRCMARMSGLRPDCEMAIATAPSSLSGTR